MTKKIRIENADISNYKVVVEVWDKRSDGNPDVLVETKTLNNPADLTEVLIFSTRYLIVKEAVSV